MLGQCEAMSSPQREDEVSRLGASSIGTPNTIALGAAGVSSEFQCRNPLPLLMCLSIVEDVGC